MTVRWVQPPVTCVPDRGAGQVGAYPADSGLSPCSGPAGMYFEVYIWRDFVPSRDSVCRDCEADCGGDGESVGRRDRSCHVVGSESRRLWSSH